MSNYTVTCPCADKHCCECDHPTKPMKSFPTWKTVTLGKFKSCENYLKAAEAKEHKIGTNASQILSKIAWTQVRSNVELVSATGAELGMTCDYTLAELTKSVASLGLFICPPEVGPALRDQYDDQPVGEWMLVPMDPVLDSDSGLGVFDVGRGSDGTYLDAYYANPGNRFYSGARWVVMKNNLKYESHSSQSSNEKSQRCLSCGRCGSCGAK